MPSYSTQEPLSFEKDIKPLFRPKDQQSMSRHFDLWSYDDVSERANAIVNVLRTGTMPCDGAWPNANVDIFQRWMDTGKAP
jgi:hypothetical protein